MLDNNWLQLPTRAKKLEAVQDAVIDAIETGTFTYTDILLADEGLYILAFEVLDGITVNTMNIPQGGGRVYSVGPIRLASIDPKQPMKTSEWYTPRVPGTTKRGKAEMRSIDLGMDTMVDDSHDGGRTARMLLLKYGWPIRNIQSRSGNLGHIVEVKWLERVASSPDATDEYRDLLAQINARASAAHEAPKTNQTRPSKAAGAMP